MLTAFQGTVPNFDRLCRRVVWIALLATLFGAALVYADKATDDRSAFVRWRHQVLSFWDGVNIYEKMTFPTPPIFPITLYPLARMPKVEGAVTWFALKAGLTIAAIGLCFRMARESGAAPLPGWAQGAIILLSLRPILSDLHHANNNLVILFLIVAALYAWRQGYDVLAGLVLSLAISYKVTPALFVPYLLYKRSWRAAGATCAGMVIFLVIVPSAIIGPSFNGVCLTTWWQKMISPFLSHATGDPQEINQSLVGVMTRLLAGMAPAEGGGESPLGVSVASWPLETVRWAIKGVVAALLVLLAWLCRTDARRRDDPRLLGEFALVALTMLFISERSWKHHYVTLLLPYTYLVYRVSHPGTSFPVRMVLSGALVLSALLMASTSTELGGQFFGGQGHKLAQSYGMFLWAGFVLYIPTAWRVWVEKRGAADDTCEEGPGSPVLNMATPHLAKMARPITSV